MFNIVIFKGENDNVHCQRKKMWVNSQFLEK